MSEAAIAQLRAMRAVLTAAEEMIRACPDLAAIFSIPEIQVRSPPPAIEDHSAERRAAPPALAKPKRAKPKAEKPRGRQASAKVQEETRAPATSPAPASEVLPTSSAPDGPAPFVSTAPDEEAITFRGGTMELTQRQAALAATLSRAFGKPVDRKFLISKVFGTAAPSSADQLLSNLTGQLREAIASLGLNLVVTAGVGIAMTEAE